MDRHRVILEFDDGLSAKLICPESGCDPAFDDPDAGECWVKGWFDNLTAEELLHGSIEVPIRAEWDGDSLVAHIVALGEHSLGRAA